MGWAAPAGRNRRPANGPSAAGLKDPYDKAVPSGFGGPYDATKARLCADAAVGRPPVGSREPGRRSLRKETAMKMIVEAFEKGLRFRDGRFVEVLEPGRYKVARIFAKEEIRKVDLRLRTMILQGQ